MAEALALVEALAVSRREAALLEQREALDVRLAIDASMMGDEMLLQLQCLRQPASLLRLLERPVWLDAWLCGEEERASLLWRRLPNDLLLHLLKLRAANKRADARRPRLRVHVRGVRGAVAGAAAERCIWRLVLATKSSTSSCSSE